MRTKREQYANKTRTILKHTNKTRTKREQSANTHKPLALWLSTTRSQSFTNHEQQHTVIQRWTNEMIDKSTEDHSYMILHTTLASSWHIQEAIRSIVSQLQTTIRLKRLVLANRSRQPCLLRNTAHGTHLHVRHATGEHSCHARSRKRHATDEHSCPDRISKRHATDEHSFQGRIRKRHATDGHLDDDRFDKALHD